MNKRLCFLTLFSLVGCTQQPVKTQRTIDLSNPGQIEFHIKASEITQSIESLTKTVAANLQGWDYPIGRDNGQSVSHSLTAMVGTVVRGSSPTGFSYSAGNSDPRSLDFQKMDVLPISCQLKSNAHPEQLSELSMDFMADKSDKAYLASDKLADHISTVCFNLLTEVKWPLKEKTVNHSSTTKSPSWIPEIRIEDKVTTDDSVTTPILPPATSSQKAAPETEVKTPVSPENTKTEEPKVRIQRDEPRRQIIIHNQGAPMILEFGYERR